MLFAALAKIFEEKFKPVPVDPGQKPMLMESAFILPVGKQNSIQSQRDFPAESFRTGSKQGFPDRRNPEQTSGPDMQRMRKIR